MNNMRLIDADALPRNVWLDGNVLVIAVDEVDNAPTIDPKYMLLQAHWISKNPHGYEWTFVCSNCGYVDGYPFNDRHNYCPNCGAKMESEG